MRSQTRGVMRSTRLVVCLALVSSLLASGSAAGATPLAPLPALPPNCAVDASIALLGGSSIGGGILNDSGAGQTLRVPARRAKNRLFSVDVRNTGTDAGVFVLAADIAAPSTAVMVSDGAIDATADAERGNYQTTVVPAGTSRRFVIWMRAYTTGPYGDVRSVTLRSSCKDALAPSDVVVAEIKVRR